MARLRPRNFARTFVLRLKPQQGYSDAAVKQFLADNGAHLSLGPTDDGSGHKHLKVRTDGWFGRRAFDLSRKQSGFRLVELRRP